MLNLTLTLRLINAVEVLFILTNVNKLNLIVKHYQYISAHNFPY